ncbi:MAG: polysaccharide lyase family protein [Planctomycetota bacterium]
MSGLTALCTVWLALVVTGEPGPDVCAKTEKVPIEMKTLWQIGSPGAGAAEFALGVEDFHLYTSRFPAGPLFVVGRSHPKRDWAQVHPGPRDAWAGSQRHTFVVRFGLEKASATGRFRLVIDLVDAHRSAPPKLRIGINEFVHESQTLAGTADALEQRPSSGRPQQIVVDVPVSALRPGDNTLTITTLTGCWLIYDRIALEAPPETGSSPVEPATRILGGWTRPVLLRRPDGSVHQQARLLIEHAGAPAQAAVGVQGEHEESLLLRPGRQHVDVPAPLVEASMPVAVTVRLGEQKVAERRLDLGPVRPWAVYVLHHTHLDIGYTHVQSEVETLQWSHLEKAVALARATAHYPDEARFRWNPEGLWAVESYLQRASPERRSHLIDVVKRGSIGLDALYANELTGLCRPEELFELTATARRLSKTHGLSIDSAMISDIPGFTWGLVPALAHSGVKYLSLAPNRGHRIGYALREWGDKPFYWSSPSGEHKVLCWMAGRGYSWFHGPWRGSDTFNYDRVETALEGERILDYLEELQESGYPYDLVQLRYNVGSDNGPPDPGLSDFVRAFNERHVVPRLVITTTREMCRALEERHGTELPVVRGDFTPYWEDGAASSARETAMNREAAERLVQAQVLWSMLEPTGFPTQDFREAWRNVLLFDEHTWGSFNSISDPDAAFTLSQWATKRRFAEEAARRSKELLDRACAPVTANADRVHAVMVFNTCSWSRSDLVVLPADLNVVGERVRDESGRLVPSQRLGSGGLAFFARDVPPLGAARFTFEAYDHDGRPDAPGGVTAGPTRMANGRVTVVVDETTGGIRSLRHQAIPADLIDAQSGLGLNDYLYVAGREPDEPQPNGPVRIEVAEAGPLLASLRIESDAPGCRGLVREVRLVAGQDRVEIINHVDKERVLEPEGVHFAYPFCVPEGEVRLDVAWAMVRPGQDQLPGACKNHFTAQRWIDVSNAAYGITLATIDAPLVQIGAIRADPIAVGWIEHLEPSATLYSYVMNNYWETNFLAGQEGPATFRYALLPHGPFDAAAAGRFGVEQSQPLIAVATGPSTPVPGSLMRVDPPEVVVTSIAPSEDGEALVVRLFNSSERPQTATLHWPGPAPQATWLSSPWEDRVRPGTDPLELPPWGIVTLRCDR